MHCNCNTSLLFQHFLVFLPVLRWRSLGKQRPHGDQAEKGRTGVKEKGGRLHAKCIIDPNTVHYLMETKIPCLHSVNQLLLVPTVPLMRVCISWNLLTSAYTSGVQGWQQNKWEQPIVWEIWQRGKFDNYCPSLKHIFMGLRFYRHMFRTIIKAVTKTNMPNTFSVRQKPLTPQLLTAMTVGPIQDLASTIWNDAQRNPRDFSESGTKSPSLCEIDPELQTEVFTYRFGF